MSDYVESIRDMILDVRSMGEDMVEVRLISLEAVLNHAESQARDIAELVKELKGAGDFARFLINNLSCATTEEDAHYLHIIDTAVAKHKEKQDG